MLWIDLLFIFLFALILSGILAWGFGWRHPAAGDAVGASVAFLFVILLLTVWAVTIWLPPWGPVWYGSSWLSILLIGLGVSLLILAVAAPPRRPRTPAQAAAEAHEEVVTVTAFSVFFWVLIIALLIAIVLSYLM